MIVSMMIHLVAKKGVEDMRPLFMRHGLKMVFDSLESSSSLMLYGIGTKVHDIKPVRIPLQAGDGFLEIIWDMMLHHMRLHVEYDLWIYLILNHAIVDPTIHRLQSLQKSIWCVKVSSCSGYYYVPQATIPTKIGMVCQGVIL